MISTVHIHTWEGWLGDRRRTDYELSCIVLRVVYWTLNKRQSMVCILCFVLIDFLNTIHTPIRNISLAKTGQAMHLLNMSQLYFTLFTGTKYLDRSPERTLANHGLNQLLLKFQALHCFMEAFRMLHNHSGCALGDHVTFLESLKQHRAWNLHNNLY